MQVFFFQCIAFHDPAKPQSVYPRLKGRGMEVKHAVAPILKIFKRFAHDRPPAARTLTMCLVWIYCGNWFSSKILSMLTLMHMFCSGPTQIRCWQLATSFLLAMRGCIIVRRPMEIYYGTPCHAIRMLWCGMACGVGW